MESELCLHCVLCESYTVENVRGYGCALCDLKREIGFRTRGRLCVMFTILKRKRRGGDVWFH